MERAKTTAQATLMTTTNLKFTTTFLEGKGGLRLVKTFKTDGTKIPYPNAKNFTSHSKSYNKTLAGLKERLKDMKEFAAKGGCILKGELKEPIVESPRAGMCLVGKENDTLMLDIDGLNIENIKIEGLEEAILADEAEAKIASKNVMLSNTAGKIGKHYLKRVADFILSHFDLAFRETTYFLHTSSSMGVGGSKKVSMHIEFILDAPLSPSVQKDWLTGQNLLNDFFAKQLQLNAISMGLRFSLDRTVADNSKLIFIGHPNFEDVRHNPIDHDDRIILVTKERVLLNNKLIVAPMKQLLLDKTDEAIKKLRKSCGLKAKAKADVRVVKRFGETLELLKNPDVAQVTIVDDSTDFVHANIGTGDSNAYWWPKSDPTLVFNFKSEPVFRLQDVDKETYDWCIINHAEHINTKKSIKYLARRIKEEGQSSGFLTAAVNTETNVIYEMTKHTDRKSAEDWMEGAGELLGERVDFIELEYNPTQDEVYQVGTYGDGRPKESLNIYIESNIWRKRELIGGEMPTYETIPQRIKQVCPSIWFLLKHIAGDSEEDATHFINWLAFVARYKEKPGTTWLFHGVQGTGKGVFWEMVITPIFGSENVRETDITALEDKFNSTLSRKTMVLVDEFRHSEAQGSKRLESKLKQMATQSKFAMRGMQKEFADAVNRFNMLFFSNARDAMRVSEDDRRINIATRQEVKLRVALATAKDKKGEKGIRDLVEHIKSEVQLFANFLHSMILDEGMAKEPRANEARITMARASRTRSEDFAIAVKDGAVEFFYDLLAESKAEDVGDIGLMREGLMAMASTPKSPLFIPAAQLLAFYKEATGDVKASMNTLNKYFERHIGTAAPASRKRAAKGGVPVRGYTMPILCNEKLKLAIEEIVPKRHIERVDQ